MLFTAIAVISLLGAPSSLSAFTTGGAPLRGTRFSVPAVMVEVEPETNTAVSSQSSPEPTETTVSTPLPESSKAEILKASSSVSPINNENDNKANAKVITPGRYDTKDKSIALPFLKRPQKLDGTHAGDFGFDPFGLTEDYDLYTMQEAELRHARLAMLAVVGWPLSEKWAPDWMLQNGCAPSVLNGFNPISFVAVAAIFGGLGFFEYKTALRRVTGTKFGDMHQSDMSRVWKYGVAGDYNFDPLGLYSSIGDDAYARKGLREVEISHGRSAMLGITYFVAWEALTGHPIVENSIFFGPNLVLPGMYAAYLAFNQFYELEESDTYVRFVMSSEGEARLENLKVGLGLGNKESLGTGGKEFEQLLALFESVDTTALKQNVKKKYEQVKEYIEDANKY